MPNNLSDFGENLALNFLMGGAAAAAPAGRFVALFTGAPGDAGGGTEVSGNGYARQAATFDAASAGATSNTGALVFTASGGDWGEVTHIGIYSAVSGGNLLWHGPLSASKTVEDGDSLTIPIGALDLALD